MTPLRSLAAVGLFLSSAASAQSCESYLGQKVELADFDAVAAALPRIAPRDKYEPGDDYAKVLVVYDDVEASWNLYNFSKTLTPSTAGEPTEGQRVRGQRLAYVSFSRALEDLRVLLFSASPEAARQELIDRNLVTPEQVEIVAI